MDNRPYQPVACAVHSEYELAILQGRRLRLHWQEGGRRHHATVTPLDLLTRKGAEYLLVADARGRRLRIRLDHIEHAEPLPHPP